MGWQVLLFVPNVIGYFRLFLLVLSWLFYNQDPFWSLGFYTLSVSLDALDGYAARKLKQVSAFGAWFDVVIDNIGRGMLWSRLYSYGNLVAAAEWLTFVCTHCSGPQWKDMKVCRSPPAFVTRVMANNFRTIPGLVALGSLQVLPIWLYAHYTGILTSLHVPMVMQYLGISVFAMGRALAAAVETWCVFTHIDYLVNYDSKVTTPAGSSGSGTH